MTSPSRLGYRIRQAQEPPLLALLNRSGSRMRPLYRMHPERGTWIGACPLCRAEDAAYVEPGMTDWLTTCECSAGGSILDLHAALVLQAVAA